MSDDYGFLAPLYQPISRLVFGKDLIAANSFFADLAQDRHSLIIGGGDGVAYRDWDVRFSGEYWDTSSSMCARASKNLSKSRICLHCGPWPGRGEFELVFLPFVLDTLPDREIETLVPQIAAALQPGGRVVLSDFFAPATFSQKLLQQCMLASFRLLARHRRKDLPAYGSFFNPELWEKEQEVTWRRGWIRTQVYRKR
ncbi:class I SAM-dependent methyltransferase [Algoriphagus sp. H41]|uniref:Class I SAM-dependent methyltransferase n=1 Tax=Algoriphagus oliviformis TaxID=2811231 RepID=A0ABS3BX53_9BACT|nr:class I SAM-dependent methyltransferase [Algoriphagus oliviformis]MBN7809435.1 class I SAM-dependent methyltransferase [Algoriphagus oliviformis]